MPCLVGVNVVLVQLIIGASLSEPHSSVYYSEIFPSIIQLYGVEASCLLGLHKMVHVLIT